MELCDFRKTPTCFYPRTYLFFRRSKEKGAQCRLLCGTAFCLLRTLDQEQGPGGPQGLAPHRDQGPVLWCPAQPSLPHGIAEGT